VLFGVYKPPKQLEVAHRRRQQLHQLPLPLPWFAVCKASAVAAIALVVFDEATDHLTSARRRREVQFFSPATADGCCGEGSSDNPATFAKKSAAYLAWRRETIQRSQAASSDSRASLPAPGPLTDAAAIRGAHPRADQPSIGGQAGRSSIDRPARFANVTTTAFFSRALGKASRAQRPHKTHRLISPPLWDAPP
jgi:hypothetical protein